MQFLYTTPSLAGPSGLRSRSISLNPTISSYAQVPSFCILTAFAVIVNPATGANVYILQSLRADTVRFLCCKKKSYHVIRAITNIALFPTCDARGTCREIIIIYLFISRTDRNDGHVIATITTDTFRAQLFDCHATKLELNYVVRIVVFSTNSIDASKNPVTCQSFRVLKHVGKFYKV